MTASVYVPPRRSGTKPYRRVRPTSSAPHPIAIHEAGCGRRGEVEAYLESAYARAFGGRIRRHYPILMSVQDAQGAILGAVGFRLAETAPLFLEQYLDEPVELAIARSLRTPVARGNIAEIGNLACGGPGLSLLLFLSLAAHLHDVGRTHAVATATRQLRRGFARVGFDTHALSTAAPQRLADGGTDWGDYYDRDPVVLAGAITPALPLLSSLVEHRPEESL